MTPTSVVSSTSSSTPTTEAPTTTIALLPISEALPTIAAEDAEYVDRELRGRYTADFGGVYVAGDVVVVNTGLEGEAAASLLRPILATQAARTYPYGGAQREVVLRHSELTYSTLATIFDTLQTGAWPDDGSERARTFQSDYPAQQIVVAMFAASDSDRQFADQTFGGLVRVINTNSSPVIVGPGLGSGG